MCLDVVDKETRNFKHGWKIFTLENGKLYGQFYNTKEYFNSYPKHEWIEDVEVGYITSDISDVRYPRGFHFYKTRKEALSAVTPELNEIIKKIKVDRIVASGKQDNNIIGVAKRIKIKG